MVPLGLRFHCWLAWPLQSQMMTLVPLPVPWLDASRHLFPYTCNCLFEVYVHRWFALVEQSHSCTCAPLAVLWSVTSRQRPDCPPTTATLLWHPPPAVNE